ncbi:serine-type D-Ala-D-Ala carboxypeptidase [Vibrio zhugei]|uniref:Serine-type D-Ala-D-Ala carboxypeptidase n=1 Tax=Vibrio zhugei TaxID=2479546 RepID=A0ABV7C3I1_9VIBR|nr:serine-type D-Ala-D-Ala carboxypeptidase [Vibrio zhugei]
MRSIFIYLLAVSCGLLSPWAVAQNNINTQLTTLSPNARYHLVAKSLDTNQILTHYENSDYFPPASTLKVLTALAATIELGKEFRFSTQLRQSTHDYSIAFSGDPSLTTQDIRTLLETLKQHGVTHIQGDLWLDNSAFTGFEKATGWPWDALGVCYSAPASAINVDHNCIPASIYSLKNGKTRVYVPEQYPIHIENQVISVSPSGKQNRHCDLDLQARHDNRYIISGCLVKQKQPLPLKFAVQNTGQYTQRIVYRLLNQLHISIEGRVRIGSPKSSQHTKTIATHYSAALSQLLSTMLRKSDNLYADSITKTLGSVVFHQPGSYRNGTAAIKNIIENHTGIALDEAQLVDGSGLSRDNRIAASTMLSILQYIGKHDEQLGLLALLPRSGLSGTLKYRRSLMAAPVKGALSAKSGTLYGTHNLVGFVYDASGRPSSVFVQYITDYFPSQSEHNVRPTPLTRIEQDFYRQIIKQTR